MAANRLDSAKEAGESRETAAPPTASAASPGGFKAWLPLLVTLLAMPALAYGVTTYILLPKLQKGLGISAPEPLPSKAEGESPAPAEAVPGGKPQSGGKQTVALNSLNKVLVNVANTMGARYLLCSLVIGGSDPDLKGKLARHEAQLKDAAMGVLMAKTIADLEKPVARNSIRGELISCFNNILGGAVVEDLYFTEFAIQ